MRTENSIKNIKYNTIFFIINIILSFLAKSFLILYIGVEYSGLNSVLKNLLEFLNITELGISTSVTYSLYKPLREKQYEKINSIVTFYRRMYRLIGIMIMIISSILVIFLDRIVSSSEILNSQIRIYFILYSIMTVCSYFFTYMQTLVIADQKQYIISKITGILNIIKIVLQIASALVYKSYMMFILIEILINMFCYIYLNKKFLKNYSYINLETKNSFKELLRENMDIFNNVKNLFVHKISAVAVLQTDSIILSMFTNLRIVAMYSNYYFITSTCYRFVLQILTSLNASVGDLIAEGNDRKSFTVWRDLYLITSFIAIVICFCLFENIDDFMVIWVGKEFLFEKSIVLVIMINLFISIVRSPTDIFKEGYGLFYDRWAPIAEAIINLVASIYLVNRFGIIGVIMGTIISSVTIVLIWKPYMIFKYGFKVSILEYFKTVMIQVVIGLASIFISSSILNFINLNVMNSITKFLLKSGLSFIFIISIYMLISIFNQNYRQIYIKYTKKIFNYICCNLQLTAHK